MKTTALYKYLFIVLFFCAQLVLSQQGIEALFIKEGVLLKCEDAKIPSDGYIALPHTVKAIAAEAFKGCIRLQRISVSGVVTAIGDRAFAECESLTKVEMLPNSVTAIGVQAFAFCPNLKEINLPNTVTTIGEEAFRGCFALERVEIPEATTLIGNRAFIDCSGLKQVVFLSNELNTLPSQLFYQCKALAQVTLPPSLRHIKSSVFAYCESLPELILPEKLESNRHS